MRVRISVDEDDAFDFNAEPEDQVTVEINGEPLFGIDLEYLGEPDWDGIRKVVVGHWPDGEEWVRVAELPIPEQNA